MKTIGLIFDDTGQAENADDVFGLDKMKLSELKQLADGEGIEYPANVRKQELIRLLQKKYDEAVPF